MNYRETLEQDCNSFFFLAFTFKSMILLAVGKYYVISMAYIVTFHNSGMLLPAT